MSKPGVSCFYWPIRRDPRTCVISNANAKRVQSRENNLLPRASPFSIRYPEVSELTEMSDAISTSPAAMQFILHWGELGAQWGISRSVAQIHALLYLSPEPLHAAQIADTLTMARSNVSTSVRELQAWGIVRATHKLGDRRDRFESLKDVWEMFHIIAVERKRREIDTTLNMLRTIQNEMKLTATDVYTRERIDAMESFFTAATSLAEDLRAIPLPVLKKLATARGRLFKILTGTGK